MGSRRSYSLSTVVGTSKSLSGSKSALTRAIQDENPDAIAASSAKLIAKSDKASDFFFYGMKLRDALRKTAPTAPTDPQELDQHVRVLWARVKREHGIPDDRAIDKVVIDSAKAALERRKR
jgi:hypothetical protein